MAKDRFSNQKPINWHSGFKQTGSFIRPYKSDVNTVNKAVTQNTAKPRKAHKTLEQITYLKELYESQSKYMSEWESDFFTSVMSVPYQISEKQALVLKKILEKTYKLEQLRSNFRTLNPGA